MRRSRRTCARHPTTPGEGGRSPRLNGPRLRERQRAGASPASVVLGDAPDHDPVLFHGHLDRTVARPVLGIDGIVLDGRVQPQAVSLLAVVERALERAGVAPPSAPAPAPAPAA